MTVYVDDRRAREAGRMPPAALAAALGADPLVAAVLARFPGAAIVGVHVLQREVGNG